MKVEAGRPGTCNNPVRDDGLDQAGNSGVEKLVDSEYIWKVEQARVTAMGDGVKERKVTEDIKVLA